MSVRGSSRRRPLPESKDFDRRAPSRSRRILAFPFGEGGTRSVTDEGLLAAGTAKRDALLTSIARLRTVTGRRGADPYRIVQSPHTPVGRGLAPAAFVRNLSSPPPGKGRWCEAPEGLLQSHGTTPQSPPGCFSVSLAKSSVFSRRRKTPRDAARLGQLTPCTGEPK